MLGTCAEGADVVVVGGGWGVPDDDGSSGLGEGETPRLPNIGEWVLVAIGVTDDDDGGIGASINSPSISEDDLVMVALWVAVAAISASLEPCASAWVYSPLITFPSPATTTDALAPPPPVEPVVARRDGKLVG